MCLKTLLQYQQNQATRFEATKLGFDSAEFQPPDFVVLRVDW